ncbi:DUF4157 domain-containing protein [Streptomyces sp. NPDC051218]|uniref:DUF4157 domain-containing protein n=1 Tax=Streptomyces sp. NPDC051218 TaxID=3365645 RepID=UPI00379647C3
MRTRQDNEQEPERDRAKDSASPSRQGRGPGGERLPAATDGRLTPGQARAMQRSSGNAAVSESIQRSRDAHAATHAQEEGHAEHQEHDHEQPVQRSSVHDVLGSPGRPFTGELADEVETRYGGADLSHLRLHTDAVAQRSAAEIGARAYTSGNHMVLGAGSTTEDVLHEVWHTFQQSRGPVSGEDNGQGLKVSDDNSAEEREARAVAHELSKAPLSSAPDVQRSTRSARSAPAVQRAPQSNGSGAGNQVSPAASQQSIQPVFEFAPTLPANPMLYTNGDTGYWVGPTNPDAAPEGYFNIDQHCSYMAVYWLLNGQPAGGLRYDGFDEANRRQASDAVRRWAAAGGRAAQEQYARTRLGGSAVSRDRLTGQATTGKLAPGTLIWFGTDYHAEAAAVNAQGKILMYDPNTGDATVRDAAGFAAYMANKNTFVVRYGPQAEHDASCKCCVIM